MFAGIFAAPVLLSSSSSSSSTSSSCPASGQAAAAASGCPFMAGKMAASTADMSKCPHACAKPPRPYSREARPLTADEIGLVKATVPILKEHGISITRHFYKRMFGRNPALLNVFNQAHQATGTQPTALALAVLAYAEHIDDLGALGPAVAKIAHKHCSLQIAAEQYPIVGENLIAAIGEVLGEAFSPPLVAAWTQAYANLADILIGAEAALYDETAAKRGGWNGWRSFRVVKKQKESDVITSFYLSPVDGGALPAFKPGQYISVKRFLPDIGVEQPRQYSLSMPDHSSQFRISVKREDAVGDKPAGKISQCLHSQLKEGDVIDVSAPYGDFVLNASSKQPAVFIAGGVGITPLLSMFTAVSGTARKAHLVHCVNSRAVQALAKEVDALVAAHPQRLSRSYVLEHVTPADVKGTHYDAEGLVNIKSLPLSSFLADRSTDYYVCGPIPFMAEVEKQLVAAGVNKKNIFSEVFGSETR